MDPAKKGIKCTDYTVNLVETKDLPWDPTLPASRATVWGRKKCPQWTVGGYGHPTLCHCQTLSEFHLLFLPFIASDTHTLVESFSKI